MIDSPPSNELQIHARLGELVEQICQNPSKQHHKEAFDQIYRLTITELKAWVSYRCHRWDMIEECLQATYVTAYNNLHKYNTTHPLIAWLKGIARNEIGKYLRRQQNKAIAAERNIIEAQLHRHETDGPDHDLAPRLASCLQRLGERVRGLVWDRYVEESSVKDIATQSGRSENAVSVSLHRAREALRRCITEEQS